MFNKKIQKNLFQIKAKEEQGFVFLEVLVGILLGSFFLLASAQAIVLATALRVQAERNDRANTWIRDDFEIVRSCVNTGEEPCPRLCGIGSSPCANLPASPNPVAEMEILGKNYGLDYQCFDQTGLAEVIYEVKEWNGSAYTSAPIASFYGNISGLNGQCPSPRRS